MIAYLVNFLSEISPHLLPEHMVHSNYVYQNEMNKTLINSITFHSLLLSSDHNFHFCSSQLLLCISFHTCLFWSSIVESRDVSIQRGHLRLREHSSRTWMHNKWDISPRKVGLGSHPVEQLVCGLKASNPSTHSVTAAYPLQGCQCVTLDQAHPGQFASL